MKQAVGYNHVTETSSMQGASMPIRCTLRLVIARENVKRAQLGQAELTQSQVAKESGLEEAQISRLATGKQRRIDFDTLDKLCRYFKVDPGDILQYTDEE